MCGACRAALPGTSTARRALRATVPQGVPGVNARREGRRPGSCTTSPRIAFAGVGDGEGHKYLWWEWWTLQRLTEDGKIEYFRQ